jgi:hypothetical protein
MTAPNLDPKALARLAIWARLCCAPIRRPPGLLHLLAALAVADFVIRILRRPRPVKPQ